MSFKYISESFEKLREHVRDYSLTPDQPAYRASKNRIEAVRALYLKWIDVYQEYSRGFEKEDLTISHHQVARLLSNLGIGLEESFFEVIRSRMPVEMYLLLEDYFEKFQCGTKFSLAEGRGFEAHTVYGEISEELEKLTAPQHGRTQADTYLTWIRDNDYVKVYYESGTYDSPLTWPLLLHEVFHAIYDKEKLQNVYKPSSNETWIPEVVIDLYAAVFFGPVYAVALAKYHERFPGGGGVSHPHQGPRLYALLQYLQEMVRQKPPLPGGLQMIINKSFNITENIWSRYREERVDLQERVRRVYSRIKAPCATLLESRDLKSFADLTKESSDYKRPGFREAESLLKLGIPAATDPRVLFNSLLYKDADPKPEYVVESLKKWYITGLWRAKEQELAGTLLST